MAAFIIFVEGADAEPDPLPVFFVDSAEHAALICEGIEATEYRIYKFTVQEVSKSDLSKFPFGAEMTIDARDGWCENIVDFQSFQRWVTRTIKTRKNPTKTTVFAGF